MAIVYQKPRAYREYHEGYYGRRHGTMANEEVCPHCHERMMAYPSYVYEEPPPVTWKEVKSALKKIVLWSIFLVPIAIIIVKTFAPAFVGFLVAMRMVSGAMSPRI